MTSSTTTTQQHTSPQLALLTCTPRRRCTPEHSMHMSWPKLREAQSGSAAPQSQHAALPGTARSVSSAPPPTPLPGRGAGTAAAGAAAAGTAAAAAPPLPAGVSSWMEGRLGEGCSLSPVRRPDREAPRGPLPNGAPPRGAGPSRLSELTSELMLSGGEHEAAGKGGSRLDGWMDGWSGGFACSPISPSLFTLTFWARMHGPTAAKAAHPTHERECVGRAGRVGRLSCATAPLSRQAITPCSGAATTP